METNVIKRWWISRRTPNNNRRMVLYGLPEPAGVVSYSKHLNKSIHTADWVISEYM